MSLRSASNNSAPALDTINQIQERPGTSRRSMLKRSLAATAGLALAGAIPAVMAAQDQPPIPLTGTQSLVTTQSEATPNTNYITVNGLDFKPVNSATGYNHVAYLGIYVTANPGYFIIRIDLPERARLTEIEFYTRHNIASASYFYSLYNFPSTGGGGFMPGSQLYNASPDIRTVSLPVPTQDYQIQATNASKTFTLMWIPGGASDQEVLYGARVGYVGGIGRFKA